jgi:hypothetical protein
VFSHYPIMFAELMKSVVELQMRPNFTFKTTSGSAADATDAAAETPTILNSTARTGESCSELRGEELHSFNTIGERVACGWRSSWVSRPTMKDFVLLLHKQVDLLVFCTHGELRTMSCPEPAAGATADDDESRSAQSMAVPAPDPQSAAGVTIRSMIKDKFVKDPKTKYSFRINSCRWATQDERQNDSSSIIPWRCKFVGGVSRESGSGTNASLSLGLENIGLQLGLDKRWLKCIHRETESEQVVSIQPRTKLFIESEVMDCTVSYKSKGKKWYKKFTKAELVEETFTVVNPDKVKFREEPL